MTREAFYENIIRYIAHQAALPPGWSCQSSDNLFDLGVLESFDLPGLVAHIERMLDKRADLAARQIEVFYTIDSMYEAFVDAKGASCAP
ncbi:hypothetical protein BE20_36945 [Sorangium cellulosum]|uniref:Carrier domain-containing protein n=1 Tax=Sorangium cellulosum TaxID=56 RepID=A0A150T005_SORCE|nr:hypothetical protein BE18_04605 [Sorangium cellulosum]KYF97898.1 hypothetical protein BE20_36945 [Sorangium cellulosum]